MFNDPVRFGVNQFNSSRVRLLDSCEPRIESRAQRRGISYRHRNSGTRPLRRVPLFIEQLLWRHPFTNPEVTYTLTNPTNLPLDYSVSLTSSFGTTTKMEGIRRSGSVFLSAMTFTKQDLFGSSIPSSVKGRAIHGRKGAS